ncbi:MAG: hypothetical protein LBI53_05185 [Candidatus Peribacteria bacterium]|nr:hypothetical protein [Candidatus Peribacteria bacterium]
MDHQVYIFSGLRDFIWETPEKAKKQYLDYVVRAEDLVSCDLYLNRFGWKNIAGHIILVFTFTSGEQLALSVEARLEEGVKFSFLRSLFYHYPIVAIW